MEIGQRIEKYRKSLKMSQEELGECIHVSRQTITKWESQNVMPHIDYLIQLSQVFGVTIDRLVKDDDCYADENHVYMSDNEMISFLVKAKQETYAAKKGQVNASRLMSHDLCYEEGDYMYYDTFVGSEMFTGEETVYYLDRPIYAMNYYGRVIDESFSGDFLKEALMKVNVLEPYRGPHFYNNGHYTYTMHVNGDYQFYQGQEYIYYQDILVYECLFHGGIIK